MLREFGSPTFFLTLSCQSPEIDSYIRKVNTVNDSYPIAKLCAVDPLSVSRKFSQKFHDFFKTVILKGAVLGTVTHHFYKKEYQSRGAPHYHILLWIEGAPVAGADDEEEVLRGSKRGSLAVYQRMRAIQSYTNWSPSTASVGNE